MHWRPISTGPPSAVTTAPNRIRASSPTVTSPQTTAVGATYADAATRGLRPSCSTSTLGQDRQSLDDADALLAPRRGDGVGDGVDRLRRIGLRLRPDDGLADIAAAANERVERDAAEQGRLDRARELLAAAGAEDLAAHVLNDADQAHVRLLRHQRGAHGNLLR